MKKIFLIFLILFFNKIVLADSKFLNLENKKISYLDFVLLKIEGRLIQRHSLLGAQVVPLRVQYQSLSSEVNFNKKDSKIVISIRGVMDKNRYSKKKYRPKLTDCNILRNILLYGKQGYNIISKKRNIYLTDDIMREIFTDKFLNNLSLSKEEKNYITENTLAKVLIIDPVRGNDIFCSGSVSNELN
tara:strand:+ start:124 stop:684 length:561 start_codon:yes stop_codon:yes gene_type:complete